MDTKLFVRRQAGGMFAIIDREFFPSGTIWWVDSGHAAASDSAGFGGNPDKPLATIDYAIGKCTANAGDVIMVMPGHAETLSAAGAIACDVAGVTIRGLGGYATMPKLTLDTAVTTDIDISAAEVTIENIWFEAHFADITACLDITGKGCTLRGCRFVESTGNMNFLIVIDTGTANQCDGLLVEDCWFQCPDAANTNAISFDAAQDACIIRNNVFCGDWGTAAIATVGVVTNVVIENNLIYNAAAAADSCINLAVGSTGVVVRNLVGNAHATDKITSGASTVAENYGSVIAEDLQGILEPIAT